MKHGSLGTKREVLPCWTVRTKKRKEESDIGALMLTPTLLFIFLLYCIECTFTLIYAGDEFPTVRKGDNTVSQQNFLAVGNIDQSTFCAIFGKRSFFVYQLSRQKSYQLYTWWGLFVVLVRSANCQRLTSHRLFVCLEPVHARRPSVAEDYSFSIDIRCDVSAPRELSVRSAISDASDPVTNTLSGDRYVHCTNPDQLGWSQRLWRRTSLPTRLSAHVPKSWSKIIFLNPKLLCCAHYWCLILKCAWIFVASSLLPIKSRNPLNS